jgi:CBS domain-containing protein
MGTRRLAALIGWGALVLSSPALAQTWLADNGNGTFTNPLFFDEFSDPDLIRVGSDYYMTGTAMHSMPGLPVLRSRDLVSWTFVSYALERGNHRGGAMRLRELMKTRVTTVAPEDTLHLADGIMSLGGLRHLPVVSGGSVLRALTVRDVMTKEVVTIDADASVREAAERLLKHKVGSLPVLERGALVGILTTSDLLHAIAGPYSVAADEPVTAAGPATSTAAALAVQGG